MFPNAFKTGNPNIYIYAKISPVKISSKLWQQNIFQFNGMVFSFCTFFSRDWSMEVWSLFPLWLLVFPPGSWNAECIYTDFHVISLPWNHVNGSVLLIKLHCNPDVLKSLLNKTVSAFSCGLSAYHSSLFMWPFSLACFSACGWASPNLHVWRGS